MDIEAGVVGFSKSMADSIEIGGECLGLRRCSMDVSHR